MTPTPRMRLPAVAAVWAAGIALGALSVGCGLILSVDYDDATIKRGSSVGEGDGGGSGACTRPAAGARARPEDVDYRRRGVASFTPPTAKTRPSNNPAPEGTRPTQSPHTFFSGATGKFD